MGGGRWVESGGRRLEGGGLILGKGGEGGGWWVVAC